MMSLQARSRFRAVASFAAILLAFAGLETTRAAPERWELCKTESDIRALQEQDGLIRVAAVPTKAAMHPEWPETSISLFLNAASLATWYFHSDPPQPDRASQAESSLVSTVPEQASSGPASDPPNNEKKRRLKQCLIKWWHVTVYGLVAISCVAWTIQFAKIQQSRPTGGWLSALAFMTITVLVPTPMNLLTKRRGQVMMVAIFLVSTFQFVGSIIVLVQRWKGTVGTIAYSIANVNGCVPYNGLEYLQQGVRAKDFRIIQVAELGWQMIYGLIGIFIFVPCYLKTFPDDDSNSDREEEEMIAIDAQWPKWMKRIRGISAVMNLLIYIPVLVYEIVIATKGMPVVISGSCMLVELDPKLGFYNSQIEAWWKALTGLAGM